MERLDLTSEQRRFQVLPPPPRPTTVQLHTVTWSKWINILNLRWISHKAINSVVWPTNASAFDCPLPPQSPPSTTTTVECSIKFTFNKLAASDRSPLISVHWLSYIKRWNRLRKRQRLRTNDHERPTNHTSDRPTVLGRSSSPPTSTDQHIALTNTASVESGLRRCPALKRRRSRRRFIDNLLLSQFSLANAVSTSNSAR